MIRSQRDHIMWVQVWTQPCFYAFEGFCDAMFPNATILRMTIKVPLGPLGVWHMSPFRLVWRSIYVVFTTILAALLPFFNDIVGEQQFPMRECPLGSLPTCFVPCFDTPVQTSGCDQTRDFMCCTASSLIACWISRCLIKLAVHRWQCCH